MVVSDPPGSARPFSFEGHGMKALLRDEDRLLFDWLGRDEYRRRYGVRRDECGMWRIRCRLSGIQPLGLNRKRTGVSRLGAFANCRTGRHAALLCQCSVVGMPRLFAWYVDVPVDCVAVAERILVVRCNHSTSCPKAKKNYVSYRGTNPSFIRFFKRYGSPFSTMTCA